MIGCVLLGGSGCLSATNGEMAQVLPYKLGSMLIAHIAQSRRAGMWTSLGTVSIEKRLVGEMSPCAFLQEGGLVTQQLVFEAKGC